MKYADSVVQLKQQLQMLGFPDGLEELLRAKICFQPEGFALPYRLVKEKDVVEFVLQFDLLAEGYTCAFYEAVLRKKILLASSVSELDAAMSSINWNSITDFVSVDRIVSALKELAIADELQASLLKFKHWSGTVVEEMIPNLSALRSRYEISQRFYFFDGELPITLDEAYRFLCNRWLEKQLHLKRKQESNAPSSGTGEVGNTSTNTVKKKKLSLLPKKNKGRGTE